MEQPTGFLKVQINMTQCTVPKEQIIALFDYGIVDHIIFNKPKKTFLFGEKFKIVIGNITTSKSVQAQIYSIPPKSYGLTKELAKHEIFLVPVQLARYTISPPRDIQFIKHMKYYLFLETKVSRKYEPLWYNFNFTTEGRTMQIWAPSNWKIRCPFSSEGH